MLDRWATTLGYRSVSRWSDQQWRDMGMLTLTFYAYTDKDNKVVVEV